MMPLALPRLRRFLALATLCSLAASTAWTSSAFAAGEMCPAPKKKMSEQDLDIARQAWKYFENNTQLTTGLVNAVNNYPSTTMWDTGSSLAAILTAQQLGLIDQKRFDQMVTDLFTTLEFLELFNGELPNKVYDTRSAKMVNYANKASETGIGVSALDLGRLASWLNLIACFHPHHKAQAERILATWNYCSMIKGGQMYGLAWNEKKTKTIPLQEGRLGYEQYAAKVFHLLGFDQHISRHYKNKFSRYEDIYDIPILVDKRDASTLGAHNYVVSESYSMDAKEHGFDDENSPLIENIYRVQEQRWKREGIVTAVSEDNLDRRPYFVYNTIFTDGEAWSAITDMGDDYEEMKTLSTKAAMSLAYTFPEREYSKVLMKKILEARNPAGGWYSGIYEDHKGFNKATTANTNGVIMSLMLAKKYGPLNRTCAACKKGVDMPQGSLDMVKDLNACRARLPEIQSAHASRVRKGEEVLAKRKEWADAQYRLAGIKKIEALAVQVAAAEKTLQAGEADKAIAAVKGMKKTLWGMSNKHEAEQKNLRRLLGTIDGLIGKWKSGNKASSQELQKKLKSIADRLKKGGSDHVASPS